MSLDVQVTFYSASDEAAFFKWAKSIRCVEKFDPVTLFIKSNTISDSELRELTALLYRYKAPMAQLRQFCNPANERWFRNSRAYWYRRVFSAA